MARHLERPSSQFRQHADQDALPDVEHTTGVFLSFLFSLFRERRSSSATRALYGSPRRPCPDRTSAVRSERRFQQPRVASVAAVSVIDAVADAVADEAA
jgi:hypothetical protein